jgi:heme/copper-type cytochrome/quinol oxidase subunit 4
MGYGVGYGGFLLLSRRKSNFLSLSLSLLLSIRCSEYVMRIWVTLYVSILQPFISLVPYKVHTDQDDDDGQPSQATLFIIIILMIIIMHSHRPSFLSGCLS